MKLHQHLRLIDKIEEVEFGRSATNQMALSERSKLIVASYNIRYGVGRYLISSGLARRAGLNLPRHRTATIANNLKTAARTFTAGTLIPPVDILALQEADKETGRAGGLDVARELAENLKMNCVHVPAGIPRGVAPRKRQWWLNFEEQIALDDPGDTGVALLSRFPLEEVARIDLPWHECAWRPRLAVGATISLAGRRIRILNAHIDPHARADGQLEQLEVMMEHADRFDGPVIVLGDFNTLSKEKCLETRQFLESRGFSTPLPTGTATWRGALLRLHADWIFARALKINRWGVARPLNVSDHWPIWAEISLPISDRRLPI
jgi:endonuclease/exonuclease/phosphatase family metal-dependent hydrolase